MKTYKYRVFSLDVWGHASDECCEAFKCPCIVDCEECNGIPFVDGDMAHECPECEGTGKHHNDVDCDADFQVNDRCSVGTIEVESGDKPDAWPTNQEIVDALIAGNYLKESLKLSDLEIDGENDSAIMVDDAKNGRPIFQLEYQDK